MDKLLSPPQGLTDAEESEWWYEHRGAVDNEVTEAFAGGRMKRRSSEDIEQRIATNKLEKETSVTPILIDAVDAKKAQTLAARKGISYQAYVQMLIHEALEKEADAA